LNIPIQPYLDLLRDYLKPQTGRVVSLAVLLLGGIGLQLLNPQIVRYFIDTVQNGGAQQQLLLAAALFLVIALAQRGMEIATVYTSKTVAWTATNHLRRDLTRHVLHLDLAFHHAHTPGELLERIDGDVDRLANFFSEFLLQIISGALLTLGVLILLGREDWRIAGVFALFVVAYMVVHTRGQAWAAPYWGQERQLSAELMGFVEERLAGVRDLQTSGATAYTMQRFYALIRRRTWQGLKADVVTDLGWTLSKIFYDLGTVASMGLGAYLFLSGAISLGTVYLIINYLGLLNGPINRIAHQLEDLQRARVAIARVKSLVETQSRLNDRVTSNGTDKPRPVKRALAVTFDDVTFGYNPTAPVLRDISFTLQPGQILGLLGRTGSGKSTLVRLLFRLYDVDQGHICLDNIDLRHLPLPELRRQIGMVTQEVQLFPASVRDNLTLFDPAIDDTQIWASLHTLGLDAWVANLPHGLDTLLTADGSSLSAGEGQLLALTRVFLKDPCLVILDEASSRLDPATEQLLERALDRLLADRTSIIIAHRLSTIRRADTIMVLEAGTIKEFGHYAGLVDDPTSIFAGLLKTGATEVLA